MNRIETKKRFQSFCQMYLGNNCSNEDLHMVNNIMALLELETDAIDRKELLEYQRHIYDEYGEYIAVVFVDDIMELSTVNLNIK